MEATGSRRCLLLSLCCVWMWTWTWTRVSCQYENSPPTLNVDKKEWYIPDDTVLGSLIATVTGNDDDNDKLTYGLEAAPEINQPFRIDETTGYVYLNESLRGRAGEAFTLYVTGNDGTYNAKVQVLVKIEDVSKKTAAKQHTPASILQSQFFPSYNRGQSVPFPPVFNKTILKPRPNPAINNPYTYRTTETPLPPPTTPSPPPPPPPKDSTSEIAPHKNQTMEASKPVKSTSGADLTTTVVPVVTILAVFVAVGATIFLFRRKIYFARAKDTKEDMRKESSPNIVMQEDPSLAMQHWRGPRAFSNRYEPWERDQGHAQANGQISTPLKTADRWEFPRHRLKFFNILGEGAFGQVWKCEAIDIDGNEGGHVVAVKTLKENATEKERSDLVSELQVMKSLEPHPNVVRLLGCCTEKDPVFVIMEYVSRGKLQSYLRNSRAERYYNNMHGQSKSLTSRDLTSFVYQVAKGMEYLCDKGIIHRDLAARNILITEDHICKVADFGFARDVTTSHVYERKSEGRLPIRWMAPESLYDNIFSVKSDVWSFGVLIWEVVTLGSTPYPGLSAPEVMRKVRDGHRLDKPEHCRRELYNIMYYCWDKDPKQRPTFSECIDFLENLLMTETDYIELERFPDHSYYNMMNISDEKL